MKSIIRWKYVIPTLIALVVLLVFFIFFFDPLLTWGINSAASKLNGAKVEVSGLSTKIFQGRLFIKRLQVTDPSQTWTNLVEAGPLEFALDPSELVTKRVIISDAKLNGLQFGTKRSSNGRLLFSAQPVDAGKTSASSALAEKYKDKFKLNFDSIKAEAKGKVEIDPKNLAINKQAEELKTKANTLPESWKTKVDSLKLNDQLKTIESEIKEAQSGSPLDKITKLKKATDDLNSLRRELATTRQQFTSDLDSVKAGVQGLKDAKKKDMDDLLSRFNLDFADPKRIVEGIIGESIVGKVRVALRYVEMVKSRMPSKKDQSTPPPHPRFRGIDIPFPTPAEPPRFWLKKAALSGIYKEVSAAGGMSDLTSDPVRVGRPFRANLKGQSAANPFLLDAVADHTGEISKDSVHLVAGNLNLQSFLGEGMLGDSLKQGSGDLDFSLSVVENAPLDGTLKLDMKNLKLDETAWLSKAGVSANSTSKGDAFKVQFLKNVARGFETMPLFSVTADISGSWINPSVSIHSNAADMLSKVVKDSVGSLVSGEQKQLESKLDEILNARTSELNQQSAGLQDKLNGLLSGPEKSIEEKIKQATGLGGSGGLPVKIPSLDKLFK